MRPEQRRGDQADRGRGDQHGERAHRQRAAAGAAAPPRRPGSGRRGRRQQRALGSHPLIGSVVVGSSSGRRVMPAPPRGSRSRRGPGRRGCRSARDRAVVEERPPGRSPRAAPGWWSPGRWCGPRRSSPQPGGDPRLGDRVDRRGRVVQHQHRRVGGQRPGQRHPLALAAGQRPAALGHDRVQAVGRPCGHLVGRRGGQRGFDAPRRAGTGRGVTLSSSVPSNRSASCAATRTAARTAAGSRWAAGRRPARRRPASGSTSRGRGSAAARSRAAGSAATTPSSSPAATSRSRPRSPARATPRSRSAPADRAGRRPRRRPAVSGAAASTAAIRCGGGAGLGELAVHPGEHRQRPEQELGQADGGDQARRR